MTNKSMPASRRCSQWFSKLTLSVYALWFNVILFFGTTLPGYAIDGFNITPDGVSVTAFGQTFKNNEVLVLAAVFVGIFCFWFLFKLIVFKTCDCFCGPGKCECTCGCGDRCPCRYRDKSAHNDRARRSHYY